MFEWIQNISQWFIDIFNSVWTFIESLIKGIADLFSVIPQAVTYLTSALGYLPSTLVVFATLSITISVIYLIVGRNTGG